MFNSPFSMTTWVSQYTHTHTHPFNGPLSGTTRVSRYQKGKTQKGKTNLDFAGARDSEWQWHQVRHMQVCTSLRQITMPAPHHSVFYRAMLCIRGTSHGPVSVSVCLSLLQVGVLLKWLNRGSHKQHHMIAQGL